MIYVKSSFNSEKSYKICKLVQVLRALGGDCRCAMRRVFEVGYETNEFCFFCFFQSHFLEVVLDNLNFDKK